MFWALHYQLAYSWTIYLLIKDNAEGDYETDIEN